MRGANRILLKEASHESKSMEDERNGSSDRGYPFLSTHGSIVPRVPTKPINITVGYGPEGPGHSYPPDCKQAEKFLGSLLSSQMSRRGGSVSVTVLAKQKPDGYHIASCGSTVLVRIPQFRPVPISLKISPRCSSTLRASWAGGKSGCSVENTEDFVDYGKKNPGKVVYAGGGPGTHSIWPWSI